MGFGLHHGWAIEGAIGSEHKVDVSYLSPHVNMSARLGESTPTLAARGAPAFSHSELLAQRRQRSSSVCRCSCPAPLSSCSRRRFGASGPRHFWAVCACEPRRPRALVRARRRQCRKIDQVKVVGSDKVTELWTRDVPLIQDRVFMHAFHVRCPAPPRATGHRPLTAVARNRRPPRGPTSRASGTRP